MDPISQGALGALASQNFAKSKQLGVATLLGVVSGMAPDLDVLIRSDTDPLLALQYHRHFTHSLSFIPIGGLICALLLHWIARRWGLKFWQTLLFCTAGFATHGLLDAFTSYGTLLFWPFNELRVAWSNISIIDPLFTVPIVILLITTVITSRVRYVRLATLWVVLYLGAGVVQHQRAEEIGRELAQSRGHTPVRLEVKPSLGNLVLWKSIYAAQDRFYVDGIRAGLQPEIYPGDSIARLDPNNDFPWLDPDSQQARDVQRFTWFSDGFVGLHPRYDNRIIDMRYSFLPNEVEGLWMIELDKNRSPTEHVAYQHQHSDPGEKVKLLMDMLLGRRPSKKPATL